MAPKLRYEFYIPTYYNDGSPIEEKKFRQIKDEVIAKFGAISLHPHTISGTWVEPSSKKAYYDNCCRFEITVDKDDENMKFFEKFKDKLKETFNQHEIYMVYTEINKI